jgi:uncharacterized membrane-anchored protein
MFIVSAFALFLVAACVFVPIFGIAFFVLKSAKRACGIAAVFALGSVAGFWIAAAFAGLVLGHAVGPEWRQAFGMAFATGGAVAGGVLAVWALTRKTGLRP